MTLKISTFVLVLSASLASLSVQAGKSSELADWATAANQKSINPGYLSPAPGLSVYSNPFQATAFSAAQNMAANPNYQRASNGSVGQAGAKRERYPVGKPTLQCVIAAAQRQQVPVDLLLAINSIERGNTGQFVGNTNGTQDIGAFQINSIHLPRAKKYKATREDLATRGCYNAEFAALLLSEALRHPKMQNKDAFTRAAGYHSWTPKHNAVYRKKLVNYLGEWRVWLNKKQLNHLVSSSF
ncbi:transglycosylase SLT domain-containing protein [Psychrobacter sp. AOP31-A1-22]|uniref:transglycosylase SLT domain-containing protein n=1 Tax=Psychrobacter sp. AOP31-A1-22 TaxID=3457696 RepID=UPI004035F928